MFLKKQPYRTVALPVNYTLMNNSCITFHERDQGSCGDCWAVASIMVIGQRRCLAYGEKKLISI
jgi:hypothetical protein